MSTPATQRRTHRVPVSLTLLAAAFLVLSQVPLIHPVAAVAWLLALISLVSALTVALRNRRLRA